MNKDDEPPFDYNKDAYIFDGKEDSHDADQ